MLKGANIERMSGGQMKKNQKKNPLQTRLHFFLTL